MTKAEAIKVAQRKLNERCYDHCIAYELEEFFAEVYNADWEELGVYTLCVASGDWLVRVIYSENSDGVRVTVVNALQKKIETF